MVDIIYEGMIRILGESSTAFCLVQVFVPYKVEVAVQVFAPERMEHWEDSNHFRSQSRDDN